jgi:hypothetical protein
MPSPSASGDRWPGTYSDPSRRGVADRRFAVGRFSSGTSNIRNPQKVNGAMSTSQGGGTVRTTRGMLVSSCVPPATPVSTSLARIRLTAVAHRTHPAGYPCARAIPSGLYSAYSAGPVAVPGVQSARFSTVARESHLASRGEGEGR